MRFRIALAVMVAALMLTAGIASAQSTTDTTTSGYTDTTSSTTEVTPTSTTEGTTTAARPTPATEGQSQSSAAPSVAAQQAPSSLAFTGGEPLLFIFAGLAIAGGTATLLVRDRRRNQN